MTSTKPSSEKCGRYRSPASLPVLSIQQSAAIVLHRDGSHAWTRTSTRVIGLTSPCSNGLQTVRQLERTSHAEDQSLGNCCCRHRAANGSGFRIRVECLSGSALPAVPLEHFRSHPDLHNLHRGAGLLGLCRWALAGASGTARCRRDRCSPLRSGYLHGEPVSGQALGALYCLRSHWRHRARLCLHRACGS